jgi:hypothetical protein
MKKFLTYGNSHVNMKPSQARQPPGKEASMAGDHPSKTRWEAENVIQVVLKINRNQDPDLFHLLQQADSKSGMVRDLLRQALNKDK